MSAPSPPTFYYRRGTLGDPLSVYTTVEQTWVEGRLIYDRSNPEHRGYAVGGHNVYRTTAEEEEALRRLLAGEGL